MGLKTPLMRSEIPRYILSSSWQSISEDSQTEKTKEQLRTSSSWSPQGDTLYHMSTYSNISTARGASSVISGYVGTPVRQPKFSS